MLLYLLVGFIAVFIATAASRNDPQFKAELVDKDVTFKTAFFFIGIVLWFWLMPLEVLYNLVRKEPSKFKKRPVMSFILYAIWLTYAAYLGGFIVV